MEVEMKIRGLMMDPVTNMPIVVLKDVQGQAILPIWVGVYEGERHRAGNRESANAAADDPRPAEKCFCWDWTCACRRSW